MHFTRFYDDDLAQASYLIAADNGDAVVVDPLRDPAPYLLEARARGLTIRAVTETHIHADFLSGGLELARATGAALHLSAEGGPDWRYRFPHTELHHEGAIALGTLTLEARHTPGHTPEHLSFLLRSPDGPPRLLSGDFAFVGDVGRPDLLGGAAGDSSEALARALFASLRREFLSLPDTVQVWPGHGAGSACGKALGAAPSTTVGLERRTAWWAPYADDDVGDEAGFVAALLAGQPDAPAYFARMKAHNRAGPAPLPRRPLPQLRALELSASHLLLDTRPREAGDTLRGALRLPAGKSFTTYASYVLDPADARGLVLLAADAAQAEALRTKLALVGLDNVVGYVTELRGLARQAAPTVAPQELPSLEHPFVLDVRTKGEFEAGHIPGAHQLHAGQVMSQISALPKGRPVVVHCQTGARAALVASALRAAGREVLELEGSFEGWLKAQKSLTQR